MNDVDETLEIFFTEAEDLFRIAEESLLKLEASPRPGPEVEELFRSLHTLKSGSAMVGFDTVSECAHLTENLLDRIRNNELPITKPLVSFLLKGVDLIRTMIDRCAGGNPAAAPQTIKDFKNQIGRFLGNEGIDHTNEAPAISAASIPAPDPQPKKKPEPVPETPSSSRIHRYFRIHLRFRKDIFDCGQDPLILLRNLNEVGDWLEIVADISKIPRYEDIIPYELHISWKLSLKTTASLRDIEDIFMFVSEENEIEIEDVTRNFRDDVDLEVGNLPLGEALVEKAGISQNDLKEALDKQKKIGEILVEDGKIDKKTRDQIVSLQDKSRAAYRKTSIRVDVNKINHLVNLSEEIGIGLSKLQNLIFNHQQAGLNDFQQELENLLKVNHEFQQRVTSVRMFPLEGTFRRYQRIARDTACDQNKQITVRLSGVDTELDKEIIEAITDPLKHIVRNCVDHGIEPPGERTAAGKPAEGVIEFRAYQKGGKIFVEISDDGRGLDVEKIHSLAVSKELLKPGDALDSDTLLEFICRPGFSTAESVTTLSGRGVGMDVVKTQVERLGGTIHVQTQPGKGTTFRLSLPLTYALTHSLHLKCDLRSFLIPVWGVVGSERFNPKRIKNFGTDQQLYKFRNEYVPLIYLSRLYGIITNAPPPSADNVLVFINTGRQQFGLVVDDVLDPHQVVVKSLETNYRSVKGISGAAIMGDGAIALVIDLLGLEELFFKPSYAGSET